VAEIAASDNGAKRTVARSSGHAEVGEGSSSGGGLMRTSLGARTGDPPPHPTLRLPKWSGGYKNIVNHAELRAAKYRKRNAARVDAAYQRMALDKLADERGDAWLHELANAVAIFVSSEYAGTMSLEALFAGSKGRSCPLTTSPESISNGRKLQRADA
jgi:hypothetical protein